jgi:hypothetical protein
MTPITDRLREHVAFMRLNWPNEPEIADDMEEAAALVAALKADALAILDELEAQINRDMAPHGGLGSGTLAPTLSRLRRAIGASASVVPSK